MISIFKRKPKEETVATITLAEHERIVGDLRGDIQFLVDQRDSYRTDAEKYRANIARLHAANARRKAQARDKQQAEVGA